MRLNLGAGGVLLPGYDNVDRKTGGEAYPLSHANDSADEVRAVHLLEHFSHRQTRDVLKEWVRVLKPGGLLKIAVPDFEYIATRYISGEPGNYERYTMGSHADADDRHGATFDEAKLFSLMESVGLTDIERWESDAPDCSAMPVSLNLQGRKSVKAPVSFRWVMSVPRLGFLPAVWTWMNAIVAPLGQSPVAVDGAFWGQCLERAMEMVLALPVDQRPEWILTSDYDSAITWPTIKRLLTTAANHPECDAIASVQVKRGESPLPLVGFDDLPDNKVDGRVFDAWLTKCDTAHFGLTLLRVSALEKMPHPWFHGQPDAEGRWGDDRTDDDIYFWRKWRDTGNSLYLANRCVIGHGDFMWAWPDQRFAVLYQTLNDFSSRGGPPPGVRR